MYKSFGLLDNYYTAVHESEVQIQVMVNLFGLYNWSKSEFTWLTDFNGMSTYLGLFYLFLFFVYVSGDLVMAGMIHIGHGDLMTSMD